MQEQTRQIISYVDSHREELIDFWRELVNHQGGSKEVERVTALIELVKRRLEQDGMNCQLIPSGGAPVLVAVDGEERKGKPILLSGHLDTVFPSGSYPDNPFVIRDGVAYGPGVYDMKGGVAMIRSIVLALRHAGFDRNPIKVMLCGDEEVGHAGTTAADIMRQQAEGCLCAFNMENGRMDNCLAVGRKGNLDCHITVKGKGGHVGNEFLAGRNAIEEMAHKILALQALSRYDEGVVVSVDVIRGGTVSNAIPDFCQIEVDARFCLNSDLPVIKQQILDVCAVTYVDGTETIVDFVNTMPVFERTDANVALLAQVNRGAAECGMPPLGETFPGGNSDASFMAEAGIPIVCACGVLGGGAHTMEEHAIVDTVFDRAKLIASAITQLEQ